MKRRLLTALVCIVSSGCAAVPMDRASPAHVATYARGAVAADHPVASEAGAEMLRAGGNAVDAAVATSFCLSVVRPYSCGLGGGGFMVIHDPQRAAPIVLDYRERCAAAVGPEYYDGRDATASRYGVHAAGVPGTVAGLLHALERYGTLDRATVLEPAIRAAAEGFAADPHFVAQIDVLRRRLEEHPELFAYAYYLWDRLGASGALAAGDLVTNPDQARALRLIAKDGADAFYRGPIASAIADLMAEAEGPITRRDLTAYTVRERAPLEGRFGPYRVLAMPPPSSGGITMLQILGLLERQGIAPGAALPAQNDADYVHALAEAMKHAFADRARWLADDAFVDVPIDRLLSAPYLDERAALIDAARTQSSDTYGTAPPLPTDGGTSHVSVIDRNGMAVACTETINLIFGSMVVVPGFGFALNDEMDDFTTQVGRVNAFGLAQSERNLPEPGKTPLSSMSPTIVLEGNDVRLVAGASGGPRIITGTLQTILNILLYDDDPGRAVARPRVHHQWNPERLFFETIWTDDATGPAALEARGHVVDRHPEIGVVQIVERRPDGGLRAASDPRKGGAPAGY